MKIFGLILLVAALVAASFVAGTQYGFYQGYAVGGYSDGLMKAENARRQLVQIEEGKLPAVNGQLEEAMREGLLGHYKLIHFKRRWFFPPIGNFIFEPSTKSGTPYDVIFMGRIASYVQLHPDAVKFESSGFDPSKLPETGEIEQAKKVELIANIKEIDDELAWLLQHYQKK